ncbi:MAG: hypothetical protein CVT75_11055 [Alphaproteobacteria bacterium HGW-Alphaproteobacteria-14]|nr:MAG: hypothetical protein CVT75_11055 [Alphaproteobacteria bacterium HGW-Alphaproteobacteria-14]
MPATLNQVNCDTGIPPHESSTALIGITHHCHILETGNDSFRFKASAAQHKTKKENVQHLTKSQSDRT